MKDFPRLHIRLLIATQLTLMLNWACDYAPVYALFKSYNIKLLKLKLS